VTAWAGSTSTNKGTLVVQSSDGSDATIGVFTVTGLTDNAGWTQLAVTPVAGTIPSNSEAIVLHFLRTGDKGADGAGVGDVVGPASATDNALARFDLTTGKLLQNSGVTADDSGNVTTAGYVSADSVRLADTKYIADDSGNEVIKVSKAASAVNEVTVGNAATGNAPTLSATGGDTNISLQLAGKGTGTVQAALGGTQRDLFQNIGYFHVHRNGTNQTGATESAFNKIQFTTEVIDKEGWFDNATNYRYTPQVAGYYYITVYVRANAGSGGTPEAAIYKNGSVTNIGFYSAALTSGDAYSNVSALVHCNGSTDYIEGYVFLSAGVTTISGAVSSTYMTGFRIGPT